MKKMLLVLALMVNVCAQGAGLKLYVGVAENVAGNMSNMKLQLVICNNMSDTVYLQRNQVDILYPRVTVEVPDITDGGAFFLVTNITKVITDNTRLFKLAGQQKAYDPSRASEMYAYTALNKELPQREIENVAYYIIAPNKCLTINCAMQSASLDYLKLSDATNKEIEHAQAYLTLPVYYFTYSDTTKRKEILISRSSDDLKKCIFEGITGKK